MNIEYIQEKDKRFKLEAKILQFRQHLKDASNLQTLDGEIAEDWLEEYDKHFGIVAVREVTDLETIDKWAKTYKVDPELREINEKIDRKAISQLQELLETGFTTFTIPEGTQQNIGETISHSLSPGGENTVTNGEINTDAGSPRIPHI